MSLAKRSTAKAKQNLILLKFTRQINDQDLELPQWQFMQKEYDECQNEEWVTKAVVSIFNSILFQQRVFFNLTRDTTRALLKADKNWDTSIGMKNENYKALIQELLSSELIREVKKGTKSYVYEVISPELLDFMVVNSVKQKAECEAFADGEAAVNEPKNIVTKDQSNTSVDDELNITPDERSEPEQIVQPATQKQAVSFKQCVQMWLTETDNKFSKEFLPSLMDICIANGVTEEDISVRDFLKLTIQRLKQTPKIKEWAEDLELQFDAVVTQAYSQIILPECKPVPKTKMLTDDELNTIDFYAGSKSVTPERPFLFNQDIVVDPPSYLK